MDIRTTTLIVVVALLAFPVVTIAVLNWIMRKRGGIGSGWGGAMFVALCWITAIGVILSKTTRG
jgi:hypothetical protein